MAKKKKAPPAEKENSERWLVSYSDFVTLLLGVFIIMYSMVSAEAEKAGGSGEAESKFIAALASSFGNSILSEDPGESIIDLTYGEKIALENFAIEQFKNKVEEYVEEIGLNDESIGIVVDSLGVHVSINDKVLFNSGKYEINPDAIPILTSIGNFIYAEFSTNNIMVKGYTDNVPVTGNGVIQSNWELGSLRAVNVLKLLVNKCSLNPTKMTAVSYGEYQPIDTNKTLEGRAKNRRVEISILRNYPE